MREGGRERENIGRGKGRAELGRGHHRQLEWGGRASSATVGRGNGRSGLNRGILGSWVGVKGVLGNLGGKGGLPGRPRQCEKGEYIRIWKGVLDQHKWVGRATPYPSHDIPGTGPMAFRLASDGPED